MFFLYFLTLNETTTIFYILKYHCYYVWNNSITKCLKPKKIPKSTPFENSSVSQMFFSSYVEIRLLKCIYIVSNSGLYLIFYFVCATYPSPWSLLANETWMSALSLFTCLKLSPPWGAHIASPAAIRVSTRGFCRVLEPFMTLQNY